MPRIGRRSRYDHPVFRYGAGDRDFSHRQHRWDSRGYDRTYAGGPPGRGPEGAYDRDYRRAYDRDMGGFGAGNLYNRMMYAYGRDYAPREHGSRPAGPSHNWGQGELARGGGGYRGGYDHGVRRRPAYGHDARPRGDYEGAWFY